MRTLRTPAAAVAALVLAIAAMIGLSAPAQAAGSGTITVSVYHQAVSPTLVTGSGIGTVRYFQAPIAIDNKAADGQYFTGTLTTLATDVQGNQEIRASNLIFVLGNTQDQLVVGGISLYPAAGATLAVGAKVVRPVTGGSGKYAGATGQVISTNLGANGWTHVFKIHLP